MNRLEMRLIIIEHHQDLSAFKFYIFELCFFFEVVNFEYLLLTFIYLTSIN